MVTNDAYLHQVPDSTAVLTALQAATGFSLEAVFRPTTSDEHILLELNVPVDTGWDLLQLRLKPEQFQKAQTWHHAMVCWDAINQRLTTYVDGLLIAQESRTLTPSAWQPPVLLKINPPLVPQQQTTVAYRYLGLHRTTFQPHQIAERSLGFIGLRRIQP